MTRTQLFILGGLALLVKICIDCGNNTFDMKEYYMVTDAIWHTYVPEYHGMLCIGCLETRMKRPLTPQDFQTLPLHDVFELSPRLQNRFGRLPKPS